MSSFCVVEKLFLSFVSILYKISLDFGIMLYLLFCFNHYIIKYCKTYSIFTRDFYAFVHGVQVHLHVHVVLISSVSIMLKEDLKNPKCFAEGKKDFICFWEEDEDRAGSVDQYSFTYTYQ